MKDENSSKAPTSTMVLTEKKGNVQGCLHGEWKEHSVALYGKCISPAVVLHDEEFQ